VECRDESRKDLYAQRHGDPALTERLEAWRQAQTDGVAETPE